MNQVYVPLMGGLGNQLFQVHAAASLVDNVIIHLDEELFEPKSLENSFDLNRLFRIRSSIVRCSNLNLRWVTRRICGLVLRLNPYCENSKMANLVGRFLRIVAKFLFGVRYGQRIELIAPYSVGFEPLRPRLGNPLVLLGYFQSHLYIDESKLVRSDAALADSRINILDLLDGENLTTERPFIVHVRLGDYSINPKIGILSPMHYLDNLSQIFADSGCTKLWLFSNEIQTALNYIPENLKKLLRVMEFEHLNESETLEIMSLGKAYLIANSTYSWWAARLSLASPKDIYAPNPWFSNMTDPNELIPQDWSRIHSTFLLKR